MPIVQALKHLFKARPATGLKILLVVAHPDDEYVVAATVYRITHELNGTVDQFTITNGEGGFRYSQLAESIYGVQLTNEATGRTLLPAIRRRETLEVLMMLEPGPRVPGTLHDPREGIVIFGRDRVEFMVVTAGTAGRQAEQRLAEILDRVVDGQVELGVRLAKTA